MRRSETLFIFFTVFVGSKNEKKDVGERWTDQVLYIMYSGGWQEVEWGFTIYGILTVDLFEHFFRGMDIKNNGIHFRWRCLKILPQIIKLRFGFLYGSNCHFPSDWPA